MGLIENKTTSPSKGGGTTSTQSEGGGVENYLHKLKVAYEVKLEGQEQEEPPLPPPPKKKSKISNDVITNEKKKNLDDATATFLKQVELYGTIHKMKNDIMKDILGYNRQIKTGTKEFLLMKCIDGLTYGRLGRCSLCNGGKLKIVDEPTYQKVICSGTFDETLNLRIDCSFTCSTAKAPRYQPWYVILLLLPS